MTWEIHVTSFSTTPVISPWRTITSVFRRDVLTGFLDWKISVISSSVRLFVSTKKKYMMTISNMSQKMKRR